VSDEGTMPDACCPSPAVSRRPSDAEFRQAQAILVGPRFAVHPLSESFLVPDLEMIDAPEHADFADNGGTGAKQRRDDDAFCPSSSLVWP
jgi:hypothetical protein